MEKYNKLNDDENKVLASQANILLGALLDPDFNAKGRQALVLACVLLANSTEEDWRLCNDAANWLLANPSASIAEGLEKFKNQTKWYPIPDYGDLYTLEAFKKLVEDGAVNNDDGDGCFANATQRTRIGVNLYSITDDWKPEFTHVLWFNK